MGKALSGDFAAAKKTFAEADDALGFPLSQLCFAGPEEVLKLTENTQPAILASSVAAFRVLQAEAPLRPTLVAGHSLGEYSALVAAGAIEFRDACKIVRERGRLMQQAVPAGQGAMAVVLGLDSDATSHRCAPKQAVMRSSRRPTLMAVAKSSSPAANVPLNGPWSWPRNAVRSECWICRSAPRFIAR
jgi:[acyl-carrier-protein] S-malonyltransferase